MSEVTRIQKGLAALITVLALVTAHFYLGITWIAQLFFDAVGWVSSIFSGS